MKVIALIDKPKSCASCPFINDGYAFGECRLSRRIMTSAESANVPRWCELRPLPEKGTMDNIEPCEYNEGFVDGRNHCIELITGEIE